MSYRTDDTLTFRWLYHSPIVTISDYRCCAHRGGPAAEEYSEENNIVLMRHGTFCKHFGRRSVTADLNQAVYFSKGSTYRVSHPSEAGDCGTVFTLSSDILNDIIREAYPSIGGRIEKPFPFVTGPCPPHAFWRHMELVRGMDVFGTDQIDPLWADEEILRLVAGLIEAAFARHVPPRKSRRAGTEAEHAEITEVAKAYLASRTGERITLHGTARSVHTSPFHFARIFHERTGMTVHRYLTRLRLRASLDRLADADDLAGLALDLGFFSHSHFCGAFRHEFGCTPSSARRTANRGTLREMSKKLEV